MNNVYLYVFIFVAVHFHIFSIAWNFMTMDFQI